MPVVVPRLAVPFGTDLHPATETARVATERWARDCGLTARPELRARLHATAPARLAGRVAPYATLDGLLLSSAWAAWLFLFDDEYCDESDIGSDPAAITEVTVWLLSALETGESDPGDVFGGALADLGVRLRKLTGPVQWGRFVQAVTAYFYALVWEASCRRHGTLAPLGEYVRMRRHSGAVATCLALIETINGFELDDRAWYDPSVRAASDAVADIICWSNDIVSYRKEESQAADVLSLPTVLARQNGLTEQQALDRCAAMLDRRIAEYYAYERPLLASGNPGLIRFASDLRHWIAGNLEWSYETGRYRVSAS
ncbi:MAG TPA: hypothetical protein VFN97_19610 [Actinospica sp.]|nr:hypothetical protein [Actinospica sp.]